MFKEKDKGRNINYENFINVNNKESNNNENINIEQQINKEKTKTIDNELVKQQYKIIKDFLIPILKEQNAKELVACYNKMNKDKKSNISKKTNVSLKNKPILEYSFVNDNKNKKLKIPLFQILFPNQYKEHLDKKNKERNIIINRPCRYLSFKNINNFTNSKFIKSTKNKTPTNEIKGRNNNINTKVSNTNYTIKSSLMKNNIQTTKNKKAIKATRSKTPPLYLRLNEIAQKHNKEIEQLRKKYEYNYNKKSKEKNLDISEDFSETSSSVKSRNKVNDFKKWYNYEKTWMKLKDIKLNIIKTELEENEIYNNFYNKQQETFKPKINKRSELLVSNKYDNNFYIRLKHYQMNKEKKENILKNKLKPKFKPDINTKYNINKEYYLYMNYDQKKINKDLNSILEKN